MKPVRAFRRSRFLLILFFISTLLALLPLYLLRAAEVPLGESDVLIYRYSPFFSVRLLSAAMLSPIIVFLALALHLLGDAHHAARRLAGYVTFVLVLAIFGAWSWWGPPHFLGQHWFNFTSPSHDGAFLTEAEQMSSIPAYARGFDERLQKSKDEMKGTRILSNTPGASMLAKWTIDTFGYPRPRPPAEVGDEMTMEEFFQVEHNQNALAFAAVCHVLWIASGLVAYHLGRLFCSQPAAAIFAIVVFFNPSSVVFSPGKDPAQLLTVCLMLWTWFAGGKYRSAWLCGCSGALLIVGMVFGLIHFWVALAALVATLWQGWKGSTLRRIALHQIGPALAGGCAVVLIAYLTWGWNIPATFWAVTQRWGEIQKTLAFDIPFWRVIGIPLFLLFIGAGVWMLWGLQLRRFVPRERGLGFRLTCSTLAVLVVCFLIGIPYELPRLWVVFIPLLVLGAAIDQPLFRGSGGSRKLLTALSIFVALHVGTTLLIWSAMDVRESEYRLVSKRLFW